MSAAVESGWPSDDAGLLAAVVAHYREGLARSGEAQRWLARRRIDSPEVIERFEVGFSDRTLGVGLPPKSRYRADDVRGRLQRLGVLRESGHEQFRGAVTFPVIDALLARWCSSTAAPCWRTNGRVEAVTAGFHRHGAACGTSPASPTVS